MEQKIEELVARQGAGVRATEPVCCVSVLMEANPLPSAPITATASPSGAVTGWLPTALDEIAGVVIFVEIEHLGIAAGQQAPHHDTADKAGPTSHQDAAAARRDSTFGALASGIAPRVRLH